MGTPSDSLRSAVQDGIAEALSAHGIVGRWTLVVEVIDKDGGTSVLTVPSVGLSAWEAAGLHVHALELARKASIE